MRTSTNLPPAQAPSPPAAETLNPHSTRPFLLISDHAGRSLPSHLSAAERPLGLPREAFDLHIAWDIGAGAVTRGLAARLETQAVLATYTRLLIDPNRPLGDPDSIPPVMDGIPVPGNQNLAPGDLEARAAAYYWPYHQAVDLALARLKAAGAVPILLSVHSFTPALRAGGAPRPWHVSVTSGCDQRLSDALLKAFSGYGLTVGFNEPYSGVLYGYSVKIHALAQGLPHAQLEIRQDLIESEAGQAEWSRLLTEVISRIASESTLQHVQHY